MRFYSLQHASAELRRRIRRVSCDDLLQPGLFERPAFRIFSFGDTVAIEHQEIAWRHVGLALAEGRAVEHAKRNAGCGEPLDTAVGPADERGVLPGIHVTQGACGRIVDGVEERDEPRRGTVSADLHVETFDERRRFPMAAVANVPRGSMAS